MATSSASVVATGKHAGSTFGAVAENDRSYCYWILSATALPRNLLPLKRWLKREYGGVLPCGKHNFKFYAEVHRDFPGYRVWACGLTDPSSSMRDFQIYVRDHADSANEDRAHEPQPAKRPRLFDDAARQEVPSTWACRICFDAAIQIVFLPCKHIICCDVCSRKIEICPLCRVHIPETLRVYPS